MGTIYVESALRERHLNKVDPAIKTHNTYGFLEVGVFNAGKCLQDSGDDSSPLPGNGDVAYVEDAPLRQGVQALYENGKDMI